MQNLRAQNNHLHTKVTELSNEVMEKENESKQVKRLKEKKEKELNDLKRRQRELDEALKGKINYFDTFILFLSLFFSSVLSKYLISHRKRFRDTKYGKSHHCT